jgi:shikimate kinase
MRNIVLVGFMGTGKTTIGKTLARLLQWSFVDTDRLIEDKENLAVSEIFRRHGENYFRSIEKGIVRTVSQEGRQVIAAGGGVMLDAENVENLKKNGILVLLTASPETIMKRTGGARRPLLNVDTNRIEEIKRLLAERDVSYRKADVIVSTNTGRTVDHCKDILERLKARGIEMSQA